MTISKKISENEKFNCSFTQISKIENLPYNLHYFHCSDTPISKIENLPANLMVFDCQYTQISKIENLPANLQRFYCSFTQISKIENLPIGLTSLYIYMYNITHIDSLTIQEYDSILGDFELKTYNLIKRLQRHIRFKIKWRNRAARIIQKRFLDHWYYPPKCRDGTVGLACQRMLKYLEN